MKTCIRTRLREQRAPPRPPKVKRPEGPFIYSNHRWKGPDSVAILQFQRKRTELVTDVDKCNCNKHYPSSGTRAFATASKQKESCVSSMQNITPQCISNQIHPVTVHVGSQLCDCHSQSIRKHLHHAWGGQAATLPSDFMSSRQWV